MSKSFRAHYLTGFWQHARCFIGVAIGRAQTCRECGMNKLCPDYDMRRKIWIVGYRKNAFAGMMLLDVQDLEAEA